MVKLYETGAYLVKGTELVTDSAELAAKGVNTSKEEARRRSKCLIIMELPSADGMWKECISRAGLPCGSSRNR